MSLVNETKSTFWSGFIFAVGANLLWGLAFSIPKILSSFTSIEITLGRYLFYGIISLIVFLLFELKHSWIYSFKIWYTTFIFAFAANIGHYFFLVCGVRYANAEITSLIIGSLPITVSLYGNWIQREYPFSKLLPSILMIISGIFIIHALNFGRGQDSEYLMMQHPFLGSLSALASLIIWTWYCVANSIFLKNNPHILSSTWSTLIGVNTLIQSLFILLMMTIVKNDTIANLSRYVKLGEFDNNFFLFLISSLILGVAVSWGGTIMWNKASSLLTVSMAGQLLVMDPIFALTYVYIYDSRLPSVLELFGIIMIIGGVIVGIKNIQFGLNDADVSISRTDAAI
ncbi:hypothetical protein CRD_02478 [Raphidiopsis brookii D9]|nr:hypothetical protein CRD_02478 [Raphidiopsis brookii D9]